MRHAGVCVFTVDKFGRRPLLLLGVGGMFVSALIIGIACQIAYSSLAATYITIVFLFVFVGSYQVSDSRVSLLTGPHPLMCRRLKYCSRALDGLKPCHAAQRCVHLPTGVWQCMSSRHASTTIIPFLCMHAVCRQCHDNTWQIPAFKRPLQ